MVLKKPFDCMQPCASAALGLRCDAPEFTSCRYSNRLKCGAAPVPLAHSRAALSLTLRQAAKLQRATTRPASLPVFSSSCISRNGNRAINCDPDTPACRYDGNLIHYFEMYLLVLANRTTCTNNMCGATNHILHLKHRCY